MADSKPSSSATATEPAPDEKVAESAPESQGDAPKSPIDASAVEEMTARAKKTLEYQIAGRQVNVRLHDKLLTFKKWGLRKKMTLGSRVTAIIQRVQLLLPNGGTLNAELMSTVLGHLSEDIV